MVWRRWSVMPACACLPALAFSSLAPAQPPGRGKLAGWVENTAGERVAGAQVRLLSRPIPARVDVGEPDLIRARTDADGFFRVELLRGRRYSAWAFWRSADGTQHRTAPAEDVIPGPPRGLLEGTPQTLRRVRLEGLEAWHHRGPLRVLARANVDNPPVEDVTPDDDGVIELPPLPGDWLDVEVRTAGGVLVQSGFDLATGGAADHGEATVEIAPPRNVRLTALDEAGAPVAGATVFVCHSYSLGGHHPSLPPDLLGHTDAAGTLAVELAAYGSFGKRWKPHRWTLLLQAPGHARVLTQADAPATEQVRVTLPSGSLLRGRILDGDGRPVAGLTLLPEAYARPEDRDTAGFGVHPLPLPTDAEGRFAFAGLHARHGYRLLALLSPARAIELGMRVDPGLSFAPVAWLAVGEPPFGAVEDLGDLRLDRLTVAKVQVRQPYGAPEPGARLTVTGGGSYVSPLAYVTDRVGRLQFPLPAGQVRVGAFVPGGGVATALVRVPPGPGDPPIDPLVLSLTRTITVRGVVVDPRGEPLSGATVRPWNRPEGGDRELAELAFQSHRPSPPTGADGAFELVLPYGETRCRIKAFTKVDGRYRSSEDIWLDVEDRDLEGLRVIIDVSANAPGK